MSTSPASSDARTDWVDAVLRDSKELAVIHLDCNGTVRAWLGASERLFGYAASEIVGEHVARLFVRKDREDLLPQHELSLARAVGRSEDDRWHMRKDGTVFWANGVVVRHVDAQGRLDGFFKLLRDRTDLRIRYDTLHNRVEALSRELHRHEEEKFTLLHELRNVAAPLLAAVRLLQHDAPPDAASKALTVLDRQVRLLKRLVDDDVGEGPAQRDKLDVCRASIHDTIAQAVEVVADQARSKSIDVQVLVPSRVIEADVDPQRMQQMLVNLISNAIKYTPDGGHVTVSATVEAEMAVIQVEDDGIGIEPNSVRRIFELFTREPEAHDLPVSGWGVGLALVKHFASLHGGFVEARSAGRGKGSQFKLQLPLDQPAYVKRRC